MKYCKKCGQEIGNSKFCVYCGHKCKNRHSKLIKVVVAIVLCISVITVGAFGVLRFANKDEVIGIHSDYIFLTEGFTDVKITDEKSAIKAVASVSKVLGIADAEKELKVKSVNTIGGDNFYRMQQYYNDIPVYGKAITVAADHDGNATALTSNYKKVSEYIDLEPTVTEEKIKKSIRDYFEKDDFSLSVDNNNLVLYETNEGKIVLAYEIQLLSSRVLVDANTSVILFATGLYDQALVECEYKDGKFMGTKVSDSEYWIGNDELGIFILNAEYKEAENYPDPEISAPMISTDNYFGNSDKYKPKEYAKAVDMLQYLQSASEYFINYNKNHDPSIIAIINDAGSPDNAYGGYSSIKDITNATVPYETEYISGICFGENYCNDLYDHIDTVGHEYTHGIINRNFKCDTDESEAINEAYADIFGELIESYIKQEDVKWIHGERNMVNPHEYENAEHPYPASIEDLNNAETFREDGALWYCTTNNSSSDFSHFASTIISHCAYLMWNGIDGTNESKIEQDKLGELWYRSIMLLQDNTSFSQCRNAVELSARMMLRNEQLTEEHYKTVVTAFDTVGIEEANFTYSSTVKNKFDLSVLSIEGSENVSYKLEVIKSIIKPGPDESELIMEKTSLKGNQSLDLENGIYIIRITDVNDTDNISQTISMRIVVDGNDSDATDEVIVYTDFTDVITVILDEESSKINDTEKYISGDYLIEIDGKIICAKSDGIYYKENIESEEKKISNKSNVVSMLSDGKTVYYVEGEENFAEKFAPKKIFTSTIDGGKSEIICTSKGYVDIITYENESLYYLDIVKNNSLYQYSLIQYNIKTNTSKNILGQWSGDIPLYWVNDAYRIEDKLFVSMNNSLYSYDLITDEYEKLIDSNDGVICDLIDDKVCYEYTEANKRYIALVDSNNNIQKSVPIPENMSLQIVDYCGEFALLFSAFDSDSEDSMFDLYKMNLKTGDIITTKNEVGRYKYKNYLVMRDIINPEDIYFGYNIGLYDKNSNRIINKYCDEFEINITKPMWIIDGYVVDWNLNTYKIYDESIENVNESNVEEISSEEMGKIVYEFTKGDLVTPSEYVKYNGKAYRLYEICRKVEDGDERFHYSHIGYAIISLDGTDVRNVDYINGQIQEY